MKKYALLLLCFLLLTGCKARTGETAPETTEPEKMMLTVYSPDDMAEGFITSQTEVASVTENVIVEQLVLAQVLTDGTKVNTLSIVESTEAPDQAILNVDFNTNFRDRILSMGTAGEYGILGSVVNTFLTAYNAQSMVITVEGEPLETGHAVYENALTYFE